ncbi:MAG: plastocyanin/azurin family copper-binding protein [Haloferacaceae archaeon]
MAVGQPGGGYVFDPPAVRVDPGTTVVWEWMTERGPHGITAADGSFTAERSRQVGNRYAVRFDGEGVVKYECADHGGEGMRGVVVVGRGETSDLGAGGASLLVALGTAITRFAPGDRDETGRE